MAKTTWKDAAVEILGRYPDGLHYVDIAQKIIESELVTDFGATPAASVNATISTDIKNHGELSVFDRVGKARYRLRISGSVVLATKKQVVEATGTVESPVEDDEIDYGYINAYGMYWDRELVDWNSKPEELWGKQNSASVNVNFGEQEGVYLLYNNEKVIYVGKAAKSSMFERLKSHTADRLQQRWNKFSWFGIKSVDEKGKLLPATIAGLSPDELIATFEALLIEAVEPGQNRQAGKGFAAIEFFQVPDPRILLGKAMKILNTVKPNI